MIPVSCQITSDKCYDNVGVGLGISGNRSVGRSRSLQFFKGAAELVIRSHVHSFFQKQEIFELE